LLASRDQKIVRSITLQSEISQNGEKVINDLLGGSLKSKPSFFPITVDKSSENDVVYSTIYSLFKRPSEFDRIANTIRSTNTLFHLQSVNFGDETKIGYLNNVTLKVNLAMNEESFLKEVESKMKILFEYDRLNFMNKTFDWNIELQAGHELIDQRINFCSAYADYKITTFPVEILWIDGLWGEILDLELIRNYMTHPFKNTQSPHYGKMCSFYRNLMKFLVKVH
jgi:hypothetical protein